MDPDAVPAHRPGRRRQRHADAGLRHGGPRVGRAQGPRARLRPVRRRAARPSSAGSPTGSRTLEARGYSFEAADASFELLLRDEINGERKRYFTVESWRVIVEQHASGEVTSEATVRLVVKGERVVAVGEGNGPVNALDKALRSALEQTFPELAALSLTDFKVRILEGSHGTGAITRVLIESSSSSLDQGDSWSTVGVDENIVAASWHALEEAVTYGLLRSGREANA